jgi:hypothetical protein
VAPGLTGGVALVCCAVKYLTAIIFCFYALYGGSASGKAIWRNPYRSLQKALPPSLFMAQFFVRDE